MLKISFLIFLLALLSPKSICGHLSLDDSCEDEVSNGGLEGNSPSPLEHRCHAFHNDDTKCKKEGCEYNLGNKKCVMEMQDCPADFFDGTECIRFSTELKLDVTVYNNGGVLCINTRKANYDKPECPSATQNWAVNFGGRTFHYEWRRTVYGKDDDNVKDDPNGIRLVTKVEDFDGCTYADKWYTGIYHHAITANKEKLTKGQQACVTYYFKVCSPGTHELFLFVIDDKSTAANQRCFDVKIGDLTILRSVDPYQITKKGCALLQIVTLFTVSDNMKQLYPKGFTTPVSIDNKDKVPLRLCQGACGAPDESFKVVAASVHKHSGKACEPQAKYEHRCNAYDNDDIACNSNICTYDNSKKKCLA